jgi:hypothetical protein
MDRQPSADRSRAAAAAGVRAQLLHELRDRHVRMRRFALGAPRRRELCVVREDADEVREHVTTRPFEPGNTPSPVEPHNRRELALPISRNVDGRLTIEPNLRHRREYRSDRERYDSGSTKSASGSRRDPRGYFPKISWSSAGTTASSCE